MGNNRRITTVYGRKINDFTRSILWQKPNGEQTIIPNTSIVKYKPSVVKEGRETLTLLTQTAIERGLV